MFEYFYHEIFRSVIIGFGTLFNKIEIQHKNDDGETFSKIKVPLAYGPTQKFLARLEQEPDLNKPVQITLPRMSFEFNGLQYDPTRKLTQTTQVVTTTPEGEIKKFYVPVPYNMNIELSIMTKLNDDMLQIVEQILPYFQPYYNLPIKLLGNLKQVKDVPIQIDSIDMVDDYEGNFDTRRTLIYTIRFTAKTYLYGPAPDASKEIIRKASIGYAAGTRENAERDVLYNVTPRALKEYDGDIVTNLADNIPRSTNIIPVDDATNIRSQTRIYINQELMYVRSIEGNKLVVNRGQDGSPTQDHVLGSSVYVITEADNRLIEPGDDFGFDGSFESF